MKKLFILSLVLIFTILLTSCDLLQGSEKLETPVITSYNEESSTVTWNIVSNATSYMVRIDGVDISTTSTTSYIVELSESKSFSISIQAKNSSSNFLDSDFSIAAEYNFVKNETGEKTEHNGLGYSVNIVFAESYSDLEYGVEVLDSDEVANLDYETNNLEGTYTKTFSSSSITDFYSSTNVGFKISAKNKNNIAGMFSNMSMGLKFSATYNYSDYSSKYYYVTSQYIEKYSMHVKNYLDYDYSSILSDNFLESLDKLENGEMTYNEFYEKYGTHLVVSGIYGGKLDAYYSVVTNKIEIDNSLSSKLNASIAQGLSNTSSTSVGLKASIATEMQINQENIETSFFSTTYGGSTFGGIGIDDFKENQQNWSESFNESENFVLIDFDQNGLIPLWDILPFEYSDLKSSLEDEFVIYYEQGMAKMLLDYDVDFGDSNTLIYNSSNEGVPQRTINDSGLFGMNTTFANSDKLDMLSLMKYSTDEFIFRFEITLDMKEKENGLQEVWLYNLFEPGDQTYSTNLTRLDATRSGMVGGVHDINYYGDTVKDLFTDTTVYIYVTGDLINNTMYLKYDSHGVDENTWYLQKTVVKVTVFKATIIAQDAADKIITDKGYFGLHPDKLSQITPIDFSSFSDKFTQEYVYTIVLKTLMREVDTGYQEFWLYNDNTKSSSADIVTSTAINDYGMISGVFAYEYGPYDPVDISISTVYISFEVTGDKLLEAMYLKYDSHGSSSDTYVIYDLTVFVYVNEIEQN